MSGSPDRTQEIFNLDDISDSDSSNSSDSDSAVEVSNVKYCLNTTEDVAASLKEKIMALEKSRSAVKQLEEQLRRSNHKTVAKAWGTGSAMTKPHSSTAKHLPGPTIAGEEEFDQALKETQLAYDQLQVEAKESALQKASTGKPSKKSTGSARKASKSKADSGSATPQSEGGDPVPIDPEVLARLKLIGTLGRQFGALFDPFLSKAIFITMPRQSQISSAKSSKLFTKATFWKKDVIKDLYDFVPEELHSAMRKSLAFGETFSQALGNWRSQMILRLRGVGDKIFPQYPAAYFRRTFDRSGVKEFNQMLKVNPASATYTQFPPILYKDGNPDVEVPFTHDCLLKIAKIMLFGATALDDSDGGRIGRTPTGVKWGLDGVTPGLIAFTGILVRFLLSPDSEFGAKGTNSNIDYQTDFYEYKRVLTVMREEGNDEIQAVFDRFDRYLFSNAPDLEPEPEETPVRGEADRIMARLAAAAADRKQREAQALPTAESVSGTVPCAPEETGNRPQYLSEHIPQDTPLDSPPVITRSLSAPVFKPVTPQSMHPETSRSIPDSDNTQSAPSSVSNLGDAQSAPEPTTDLGTSSQPVKPKKRTRKGTKADAADAAAPVATRKVPSRTAAKRN